MSDKNLREQLIGTWRLVSYIESPVDGLPKHSPLGEKPEGMIMYTPDGYMSAQLMRPGRKNFASNDWFMGTPEEFTEEATGYIAYSGPFHVDEEKCALINISLVRVSIWLLHVGIFDKKYAREVGNTEGNHAYLAPELFQAETPSGHYQGVTDQVRMSETPGSYKVPLVLRGSGQPIWLPRT